jgi:malate synthase
VTAELVRELEREELDGLRSSLGDEAYEGGRFGEAAELFEQVALADEPVEFLTLPAIERLE